MMKQKILLLAYGEMGQAAFQSLIKKFAIVSMVTPETEVSLYREESILPVEALAQKKAVPILQTNSLRDLEDSIKQLKPDAVVISSYNKIIPPRILKLARFINVHHGDLPRWRGRANLNWAIILGRETIGLTIHDAAQELDAGNIYAQYNIPIGEKETIATLYKKVNALVEQKLADVVSKVIAGYQGEPQKGKATYCCTRLSEDGLIDWSHPTLNIDRLIRALTHPFPGAFTYLDGEKMCIWEAEMPKNARVYEGRIPGRVVKILKGKGLEVLTGDASLLLTRVSYHGIEDSPDRFVLSVKKTLGLNFAKEYERLREELASFKKPRGRRKMMSRSS